MKNLPGSFASLTLSAFFLSVLFFASCKKGDQGLQGTAGTAGTAGSSGVSGNTILSGDGVPSSTLGNIGDFYLELDNTALYGPKTVAGWGSQILLQGAAGTAGQTGATGDAGAAGSGALVDTFCVKTADWAVSGDDYYAEYDNGSAFGYPTQTYTRYNSTVTKGILDSGMVLVYFTADQPFNPTQWLPVPYSSTVSPYGSYMYYNWSYLTTVGKLELQFFLTPFNTTTASLPDISTIAIPDAKYKIVVVSGTITQMIATVVNKKITKTGHISNN